MSKFSTRIPAIGSEGNIFIILSRASYFLNKLGASQAEIDALANKVFASKDYKEAVSHIEEYFTVYFEKEEA